MASVFEKYHSHVVFHAAAIEKKLQEIVPEYRPQETASVL